MGREVELTPCVGSPWILAVVHGNAAAYNRHRCRCTDAVEDRKRVRARYEASPAGRAYRDRQNKRRMRERRGPDGLTVGQRGLAARVSRARELRAAGRSVAHVARLMGVCTRTAWRWLNEVSV